MDSDCRVKCESAALSAVNGMLGGTCVGVDDRGNESYRPTSPVVLAAYEAAGGRTFMWIGPARDDRKVGVAQWLRSIADYLDPQGGGRE
jgi:hypothetical protein